VLRGGLRSGVPGCSQRRVVPPQIRAERYSGRYAPLRGRHPNRLSGVLFVWRGDLGVLFVWHGDLGVGPRGTESRDGTFPLHRVVLDPAFRLRG
jgi:hypothetical protein